MSLVKLLPISKRSRLIHQAQVPLYVRKSLQVEDTILKYNYHYTSDFLRVLHLKKLQAKANKWLIK